MEISRDHSSEIIYPHECRALSPVQGSIALYIYATKNMNHHVYYLFYDSRLHFLPFRSVVLASLHRSLNIVSYKSPLSQFLPESC